MRRPTLLLLTLFSLVATWLVAQTHPNLERGMNIGKSYQIGDIDSVSMFNGSNSIAIPLGQTYSAGGDLSYSFVLRYNSNLWDHDIVTFTNDCFLPYGQITVTQTSPHQLPSGFNGGVGWSLDFGTLLLSGFGSIFDDWTYVAPDGSTHRFYETMHEGETAVAGYRYTRDGSYMRLVASNYSPGQECAPGWLSATVEFADGRRQTFSRTGTCFSYFTLNSETDRFGNSLTFTYDGPNSRWVLHDSQGRDHYVYLEWRVGFEYRVITRIDLAAFDDPGVSGAQRAVYTLTYATESIARSCKHYYDPWWDNCDPMLNPTVEVPLLTDIAQPDGSLWTMLDQDGNPGYNLDQVSECSSPDFPRDRPGTITNLKAPTGGTYVWTYATWRNPEGAGNCYTSPYEWSNVQDATGVATRVLDDPLTDASGEWAYTHDSWHLPSGEVDAAAQESWTVVTTPQGDQSKHYFRTQYCGDAYEGWDYGLPYTSGRYGTVAEPGPFVSTGSTTVQCIDPANLKRTSYLRYDKDTLNPGWSPSLLQQSNRRVDFEKTVFADDANHYTTVDYSTLAANFDGLGHYRVVSSGGDFGVSRQTTTAYNTGKSYPPASPPEQWWPTSSPWVINTYTSSKVTEGGTIAKSEACFEAEHRVSAADPGAQEHRDRRCRPRTDHGRRHHPPHPHRRQHDAGGMVRRRHADRRDGGPVWPHAPDGILSHRPHLPVRESQDLTVLRRGGLAAVVLPRRP